jgi:hypothetical protein
MNISHFYPQYTTFYHYYFILWAESKEKVQEFPALLLEFRDPDTKKSHEKKKIPLLSLQNYFAPQLGHAR